MWDPVILDVECIVCNKTLQKINHDPRKLKMGKIANTNRRSRTPNWSPDERQCLLDLIKQRKEVLVTKTNSGSNHYEEKGIAWNEILAHLSHRFGSKFSESSTKKVKTQWQNMKRIAREEIAAHGPNIDKYTKLSLEVCHILDLVKDGMLIMENVNLNETTTTGNNLTNIEIKTECLEEDVGGEFAQPGCSGMNNPVTSAVNSSMETEEQNEGDSGNYVETLIMGSSPSSTSERAYESSEYTNKENNNPKHNTSASTSQLQFPQIQNNEAFQRDLQQFFSFSLAEKQLKIETLKDERHAARALREMAELKKIAAEQKLKHVLWVKKHEMAMYVGEPGSGAGKGGGGGGAIREAGGAFGKMEAAREDEYFYKKQKQQLKELKSHLDKEISFHQEQIKRHEDAIKRHKEQVADMDKQ